MEDQLLGGNFSAAVKVGDTVRRRAEPWTPSVHALLEHLHRAGFDAAPEPLRMDEQGRAVLKFIPGEVHHGWPEPMPSWVYEDKITLVGAAQLPRRYHDMVATFTPPSDVRWRIIAPGAHEVICHNDWAPYNAVFAGHRPIAMLDWDGAGPGSRVWDVGWSAYTWVPLYPKLDSSNNPVVPLAMRASRLAKFCTAYRGIKPSEVLETLVEQLRFLADFVQAEADAGDPGFAKLVSWNVPARTREHARLLRDQMHLLLRCA